MRAAVYKGEQVLQVEEIPDPTPGPNQVVMRVKYSAICGTDVHAFLYDLAQPGAVMGHEYTGTIVDVGADVTRWKTGDRVVGGGGHPPPGAGSATRTNPRFNYRTMGFQHNNRPRGYAEYVLLDEWEPTAVPDDVTDEQAALCEPCAVTVHAVRLSGHQTGRRGGCAGRRAHWSAVSADGAGRRSNHGYRVGAGGRSGRGSPIVGR